MAQSSDFPKLTEEEYEKKKAEAFNQSKGYLNEEDGYDCHICNNHGIIMRAEKTEFGYWQNVGRNCDCMKIRIAIKRMERSGLKNIIKDYTFSKFIATDEWQKKLKEAAETYANDQKGWFFIGGQSGAGKTHLCCSICRELLYSGHDVKYMMWREDCPKIKAAVNDSNLYQAWMEPLKTVDVLYIDDLFKTGKADSEKQKPTMADINIAFEILNYRYNSPSLLTIISSECTVSDIIDIDEAVGGRIFEKAKAFSLKPDRNKNYRLKGVTEL